MKTIFLLLCYRDERWIWCLKWHMGRILISGRTIPLNFFIVLSDRTLTKPYIICWCFESPCTFSRSWSRSWLPSALSCHLSWGISCTHRPCPSVVPSPGTARKILSCREKLYWMLHFMLQYIPLMAIIGYNKNYWDVLGETRSELLFNEITCL